MTTQVCVTLTYRAFGKIHKISRAYPSSVTEELGGVIPLFLEEENKFRVHKIKSPHVVGIEILPIADLKENEDE